MAKLIVAAAEEALTTAVAELPTTVVHFAAARNLHIVPMVFVFTTTVSDPERTDAFHLAVLKACLQGTIRETHRAPICAGSWEQPDHPRVNLRLEFTRIASSCLERKTSPRVLKLTAANGSSISTYGQRMLTVDLGLSCAFPWAFIVADVKSAILGAD